VVVASIVVSHRPLYSLAEWVRTYDPGLLGLESSQAAALNDDRVGRMLDRLFDADRVSLVTETVLKVIEEFEIELDEPHNDSTTVTVTGTYDHADGYTRGGKPTPALRQGHNKDFRPDLLTELLKEFSQFRVLPLDLWFMVPARGRRQHAQGSQFAGGAIGGVVGGNRRSVGALSAA